MDTIPREESATRTFVPMRTFASFPETAEQGERCTRKDVAPQDAAQRYDRSVRATPTPTGLTPR